MSDSESLEQNGMPEFLSDPKGVFRRRWRWIIGVLAVGLLATTAGVAFLIEPLFVAKTTILVTDQAIPDDFIRSTVEENSLSRLDAIVGAVLSREGLADLIEKHDLYSNYRDLFTMGELIVVMRDRILIELETGVVPNKGSKSRVVGVQFQDERAVPAAAVANELASQLVTESVKIRTQQARVTTEFLRTQLTDIEQQLKVQERLITEFHLEHRGTLPSELEANLRKLERLQQERQSLAGQINEAETRIAVLRSDPGAAFAPDTPQGRLALLRTRLNEELGLHTDDHPNVASIRRQIAALESQIGEGGAGSASLGRNDLIFAATRGLEDLRAQLVDTNREIEALDQQVVETPVRSEELADLTERAEVLRASYVEFLGKVQNAELAESLEAAQQGERISVLDRAVPPAEPAQTRLKYLAVGYFLTIAAALGLAFLLELFDPVLISGDQIESKYRLPVLGSVPHIN